MISVDEYLAELLNHCEPLPAVDMPLEQCLRLTAARGIRASTPLPGFDNSAMDGYAVHSSDLATIPVLLPVIADIAAGSVLSTPVPPGSAARIMTGAPIPEGPDCVVAVESTDGGVSQVRIDQAVPVGAAIRPAGSDIKAGAVLIEAGLVVTPARIALVAAAGYSTLNVIPGPRVAVISTGAELRPSGSRLGPGQLPDSNGPALVALLRSSGFAVDITHFACYSDGLEDFQTLFHTAAEAADLVITTGGVSAGAYEVVKEALGQAAGLSAAGGHATRFKFQKVAMQPGKPQGFGVVERPDGSSTLVLNFPGNPVSAVVSFVVLGLPVLGRLAGRAAQGAPVAPVAPGVRAVPGAPVVDPGWWLAEPVSKKSVRQYLRGVRDQRSRRVDVFARRGSYVLSDLAQADCLVVIPEGTGSLAAGFSVEVIPLPA